MNPKDTPPHNIHYLLRLKRYEQPPAEYYEQVLEQFQQFREAEAARRSSRLSIFEKINSLLPNIRIPGYAYATIGLFAIIASTWILTTTEFSSSNPIVSEAATQSGINLYYSNSETLSRPVEIPSQRFVGTLPPHYVLQNRPTEHNEPFSF